MLKKRVCAGCAILVLAVSMVGAAPDGKPAPEAPRASDPRLVVEAFAGSPEIVHPIGLEFDRRGRLLVIESHTHFRPAGYKGPKGDRVRILEDSDGDGKADRISTFFEGTQATMDIAAHPDGSVYLATRSAILRLRDADGDGKAEDVRTAITLDTPGNYPHNGLSGLAFDAQGNLIFGMGENLGADYTLRGTNGIVISGGGEGGGVFTCSAEGRGLRRIATGFWNPFGVGRDVFGRLFAVDNDPDSMPPCRLLHVVEGGDYGYQFRYGRSGRHVFQAWNGELTGTLPLVSGTGEAPCEVISYESDGLPREYVGNLLVTSWADHRIERHVLKRRGASVVSEPQPFVRGGTDFRPTGMAVAPDGSIYVADWMLRSYELHGKGAVWHVRWKDAPKASRSGDARGALLGGHRASREDAARILGASTEGREFLRLHVAAKDSRVRAAALTALVVAGDRQLNLRTIAENDAEPALRALAVRALAERREDTRPFLETHYPPEVRLEAIAGLAATGDAPRLLALLDDADPFLRNAAVHRLARAPELLAAIDRGRVKSPRRRAGLLLAYRGSRAEAPGLVSTFLADPDEDVRFLAVKWIADERLVAHRSYVASALDERHHSIRFYSACATALARLDRRDASESKLADFFLDRLADDRSPTALRVLALQLVPATHPRLTIDLLKKLLAQPDPSLRLEAVRALSEHPSAGRFDILGASARDTGNSDLLRAQAIVGLAERAATFRPELLSLAQGDDRVLRDEALRALLGTGFSDDERNSLRSTAGRNADSAPLVERALGRPFANDRPPVEKLDAWLKRLEGPADPDAGRRVFFHPKLAGCFRCHRVEGRGQDIGPDLSAIGRTERRHLVESILQPSNEIGPSYQNWQLETSDGKLFAGMLMRTNLDQVTYVDAKGALFTLSTPQIAESRALPTSIMPAGLADLLTDQELRDLVAYLSARR